MTEKTAKRIAKALEHLAGNTTNNSININKIIKSLVKTHDKLQIVKVIKDIEVCSLKRAKEIVDPVFKECTRNMKLGGYNR